MSKSREKLATAKAAQRPTKDVSVVLDEETAAEKARLEGALAAASNDQRLGSKSEADLIREQLAEFEERIADDLVTIRITRLPGRQWAVLTSRNPVRVDVVIDRHYGYNFDAVCEAAARFVDDKTGEVFAHFVDDDELTPLTLEDWDDLFDRLSGAEITSVRDVVWELNEWGPQQRVQELVKASGAATRSDSK